MIGFNSPGAFSSVNHLHFQFVDFKNIKTKKPIFGEWAILNAQKSEGNDEIENIEICRPPVNEPIFEKHS